MALNNSLVMKFITVLRTLKVFTNMYHLVTLYFSNLKGLELCVFVKDLLLL